MARVAVKLDELLEAFEFVSFGSPYEHAAYLSVETGEIHYRSELADLEEELPDDIDDSEKYIAIPHKNDLDLGKRLVLRFAEDLMPEVLDDVYRIFTRKGAYSRFKSLLERRGMLERWYEYEQKSTEEALREWCADNDIEFEQAGT